MSQGGYENSQKAPKSTGTCGVCWATFKLHRATGHLHRHGHRDSPCSGSDTPPVTAPQRQPSADATQRRPCSSSQQCPDVQTSTLPITEPRLSHPPWIALVRRIPRAARASCAALLTQILQRIVASPNNKTAWRELLHFGPVILAKPKRGGTKRNLSNIINSRVAAWDKDEVPIVQDQTGDLKTSRKSSENSRLAAAVSSKLEAGNFRAAVRIVTSSDTIAKVDQDTLEALRTKHPAPAKDQRIPHDPGDNPRFRALQVSKDDIVGALRTFPLGSTGGPDGITPQHIRDLMSGATDDNLQEALVDFVNLTLAGAFDEEVNSIIFGGRLIALAKKDGGIRPINVGYTLRRLVAKCANSHVIKKRSQDLQPLQLGVGISGGAEAAVHAMRRLLRSLPPGHVVVKLDFSNAFNTVRRDLILDMIAANIPEIYCLVHAAFQCDPILSFGQYEILSREGAQQGDPLGSLEFCEALHPLLLKLQSTVKIGFMDDVTLSGDLLTVESDIKTIVESSSETGLCLNMSKCEIIMDDFTQIDASPIFRDFIKVEKDEMTLLGAPVLNGKAQDIAIQHRIDDLSRASERLTHLHAHDALTILKNSLAMPKLLYLLRTSECSNNPLLSQFDDNLRAGLSRILNVNLNDDQWLQASLPVGDGGLGIRSARMLAPSAFLASAASTLPLQQSILPDKVAALDDRSIESTESSWSGLANSPKPAAEVQHIQKAWDGLVTANHRTSLLSRASCDLDKARVLAASSPHSGDWLHAPPITAVGLRLSDEAIRVAVAHRLGCKACEPHTCACGKPVDARGLHGLCCRRSAPRQQRHSHLNDIIWRAVKRAQIPAVKEPVSLICNNNKRPDGCTLLPWARGKPMTWDVTVPDTYADSHIRDSAIQSGSAAQKAAQNKEEKYAQLTTTHIFYPFVMETGGTWHKQAIELTQEIGRRITMVTEDNRETTYLFQRLSIALQRGNAVSFQNTMVSE